jgi:hypothetical protein
MVEGKEFPSIFTFQSQTAHRNLKAGIAQKYSLSSLLSLEPLVDKVTRNFMSTLRDRAENIENSNLKGARLDLGEWLQFYAFDVIGAITFSRTFGFIDAGCDFRGVLRGLEGGLRYGALVGQVPALHSWLMANPFLQSTILKISAISKNNPVPIVYQVSSRACFVVDTQD